MRALCDLCGSELHSDSAVVVADAERVHFFCSPECAVECGFHGTISDADAGGDEDTNAP